MRIGKNCERFFVSVFDTFAHPYGLIYSLPTALEKANKPSTLVLSLILAHRKLLLRSDSGKSLQLSYCPV